MQVQVVEVSYLREKQPKDYEKVVPTVKLIANVSEDDNHVEVVNQLMFDVATAVHAGMGLNLPASIAKKLGVDNVKTDIATKTEEKIEQVEAEATRAITETPEDRKNPEDDLPSDLPTEEPKVEEQKIVQPETKSDEVKIPEGLDAKALHKYMTELVLGKVTKKKVDANDVTAVFKNYGVARVSDLEEDKLGEVYLKLHELEVKANEE